MFAVALFKTINLQSMHRGDLQARSVMKIDKHQLQMHTRAFKCSPLISYLFPSLSHTAYEA